MSKAPSSCYAGVMTGTSMDAIDVAIIRMAGSGGTPIELVHFTSRAFDPALAAQLAGLQASGPDELDRASRASVQLAHAIAQAVQDTLRQSELSPGDVQALGVHGQTVRHRPELGYTIALNQPAQIVELTGMTVVSDFRSRDIAAGGQGAPLVPAFHHALFAQPGQAVAVVNIGGMANVSWLGESISGHDTGPGNVLLDLVAQRELGEPFDRNGDTARAGQVHAQLLEQLLTEPYFSAPAPKSTGRDLFHAQWLDAQLANVQAAQARYATESDTPLSRLTPADLLATLVELTAITIAESICQLAQAEQHQMTSLPVLVCGGGIQNSWLMERLNAHLRSRLTVNVELSSTAARGWPPQAIESAAFAWLAYQAIHRQPGNIPSVTGAQGPRVLGSITPA